MAFNPPPWPPALDADATQFGAWLSEQKYGGHPDILAYTRWGSDYRQHRANGVSHDDAWTRVSLNIDEIRARVAVTAWPAGQYDVPWPPEMDADSTWFGSQLTALYHDKQQRDVDILGWVRWASDFRIHRANGLSKEAAWTRIERDILRIWGLFVEPTPAPATIEGPLTPRGHGYVDRTGAGVRPLFCHWGEGFSAFVHCTLGTHHRGKTIEDWRAQARTILEHYAGWRSWHTLGYYEGGWNRKEVSPIDFTNDGHLSGRGPDGRGRLVRATPGYYDLYAAYYREIEAMGAMVMDDRGDLNSWTDTQKREFLRACGETLQREFGQERALKIMVGLWACNESWQNGVTTTELAGAMLNAFRAGAGWWPPVRGLSCPPDISEELEPLREWSVDPATVMTVHPLRDTSRPKGMLEHYFTDCYGAAAIIGKPAFFTEPIGSGSGVSGDRTSDVELLVSLGLIVLIAGGAYTWITGHGIFWDGPIEDGAAFRELPRAARRLPADIGQFRHVMHSGDRQGSPRMLVVEGDERFDFALHDDGRFAGLAYNDHGLRPMPVARAFRADVINPETDVVEWSGEVRPGQRLPLSGRLARLVVGQLI